MSTVFHAKYYASELTKQFSSEKLEKLSQSLFNATVDLNPHQIDTALFAFRSPLSRGAILTATPLQNSLMELYGLVSFIDPHLFGSEDYFRSQYARHASEMSRDEFQALRTRVQPVCHRILRRQVAEYIRYTNRIPITQDFTPSAEEERLYNAVSAYLQREESYALPSGQRALMTLVLRKILASSSFAIANTLGSLVKRLEAKIVQDVTKRNQAYFEAEMDKLENWAEDLKQGLERELKELDREIKSAKKEARQSGSLDAKVALPCTKRPRNSKNSGMKNVEDCLRRRTKLMSVRTASSKKSNSG